MTNLQTLLSRVESGSGADKALSNQVCIALGIAWTVTLDEPGFRGEYMRGYHPDLTTDLNAVVALVEARLPGWWWAVGHYGPNGNATANVSIDGKKHGNDVTAPTPARALLAALIRAEIGREG